MHNVWTIARLTMTGVLVGLGRVCADPRRDHAGASRAVGRGLLRRGGADLDGEGGKINDNY